MAAIETILPEVAQAHGAPLALDPALRAKFIAAMPGLKERAKTLVELLDSAYYLYVTRPLKPDAKAESLLDETARKRMAALADILKTLPEWTIEATEAAVRSFAEAEGAKLGQIAQPLRAALTGRGTSPPIFDVMVVIGKEETLARLADLAL